MVPVTLSVPALTKPVVFIFPALIGLSPISIEPKFCVIEPLVRSPTLVIRLFPCLGALELIWSCILELIPASLLICVAETFIFVPPKMIPLVFILPSISNLSFGLETPIPNFPSLDNLICSFQPVSELIPLSHLCVPDLDDLLPA